MRFHKSESRESDKDTPITPMKSRITCLVALLLTSCLIANANVFGDYNYSTNDVGEATLISYTGTESAVTVPGFLDGNPVVAIGQSAFYGKNLIQYVHLPDSVQTIEPNAFQFCSFTNVVFGTGLTNIGYHAFWGCENLRAFTVPAGNTAFSDLDGVLFNVDKTTLIQYPQGKAGTGNYSIPDTVRTIASQAFASCSTLTNIDLPNNLNTIGDQAFYSCQGITNTVIPDSVTNSMTQCYLGCSSLLSAAIGNGVSRLDGTFTDCPTLNRVTLGTGVTNLTETFIRCYQLRSIDLPPQINTLGDMAFSGAGLYSIDIHGNITTIGDSAFSGCYSLTSAALNEGLLSVGRNAFDWCSALQDIHIPDTVTNLGDGAFDFCKAAKQIHIGEGITRINDETFYACHSATNVEFSTRITSIGKYAFDGCTNLTTVKLPASVTTLEDYAFCGCTRLVDMQLNNTLTSIGNSVFKWCDRMPSVFIPASVTNIGYLAWEQCYNLASINVDPANEYYATRNGILYDKAGTTLLEYPAGIRGTAMIPDGTIAIGLDAFVYCSGVTNVVFPNTLTSIGENAFDTCPGLTGVTIPASVTNLGYRAFIYCNNLNAILFEGDAPTALNYALGMGSPGPAIYYLPGTSGWESGILDGRTTTLWNPAIAADGNMRIENGQFRFNITGNSELTVIVEAAKSLQDPVWVPVSTNSLYNGPSPFTDADPAIRQARFYRIRSPL